MKRTTGFVASVFVFVLLALVSQAKAETLTAFVPLSPANETPPIAGLNATGLAALTFTVNRDGSGNITSATINFLVTAAFTGSVTVTGLHIHEGVATTTGSVVFNTGLSSGNSLAFASGSGLINLNAASVDITVFKRLLANPAGFYVNLHTSANPNGAIRGQLTKLVEVQANTTTLSTSNEVPPITTLNAGGTATITANPLRDVNTGLVTGGTVTFSVIYDIANPPVTISGLHIHEAAAGVNGSVVINTGIGGSNTIVSATGKGTINIPVQITSTSLAPFQRMLANPTGFYVNLHTSSFPNGLIRGQLAGQASPPIIAQATTYFLPTGTTAANVGLLVTGIDLASSILVNGLQVTAVPDFNTGAISVEIPSSLLGAAGTLFVQARNSQGLLSTPVVIAVAPSENVNTVNPVTVDAARYGPNAAPESIVAIFGTNLATQTLSPTTATLPYSLDGTTVLINGLPAPIFFVSTGQVNVQIPPAVKPGVATVIVTNKNNLVSRGTLTITNTAPAIFTRLSNGTGAPAASASVDGQNFNLPMSNPDGSPIAIDAGNTVMLFGTSLRFNSGGAKVTLGGTDITPSFVGAQNQFIGLDQINFQVPLSLAGRGDMDLTVTIDGRTSNVVKLKVR